MVTKNCWKTELLFLCHLQSENFAFGNNLVGSPLDVSLWSTKYMYLSSASCYCAAHNMVLLHNSGPCDVSSLTTAWSKLSHEVRPGLLRTSSCEGWKPYQEGVSSVPTALMGKTLPFISYLSDLAQPLHTVSPSTSPHSFSQRHWHCC